MAIIAEKADLVVVAKTAVTMLNKDAPVTPITRLVSLIPGPIGY